MPEDFWKDYLERSERQELRATIEFLSKRHRELTGRKPRPEELIETLRDRGQRAHADELERLVAKVRAGRARE